MKIYGLSAPIRNYGDVLALIFSHRIGANQDAERKYVLFAVDPAIQRDRYPGK